MKLYATLLCLILSAGAQALESLTKEELLGLCGSRIEAQVAVCDGYITGFLDGAYATDPEVAENVVREMREEESFSERAIRTRLGMALERFGPVYYAGLCIPADLTLQEVRAKLVSAANAETVEAGAQGAGEYLYQSLRTWYPCENPR